MAKHLSAYESIWPLRACMFTLPKEYWSNESAMYFMCTLQTGRVHWLNAGEKKITMRFVQHIPLTRQNPASTLPTISLKSWQLTPLFVIFEFCPICIILLQQYYNTCNHWCFFGWIFFAWWLHDNDDDDNDEYMIMSFHSIVHFFFF